MTTTQSFTADQPVRVTFRSGTKDGTVVTPTSPSGQVLVRVEGRLHWRSPQHVAAMAPDAWRPGQNVRVETGPGGATTRGRVTGHTGTHVKVHIFEMGTVSDVHPDKIRRDVSPG